MVLMLSLIMSERSNQFEKCVYDKELVASIRKIFTQSILFNQNNTQFIVIKATKITIS